MGHDEATIDPLIAWMDAKNKEVLRQASDADAASSLRRLMEEHEPEYPYVDADRLASAAWALEQCQKWNAPAIAIGWLKERPSRARLAVVMGVLLVAWNRQADMPPTDPAGVEELLSVYARLPYDVLTENGLLIVLTRLHDPRLPTHVRARVTDLLSLSLDAPDRQPEVRAVLESYFASFSR